MLKLFLFALIGAACAAILAPCAVTAEPGAPLPLWPGRAPGETAELPAEGDTTKPNDRPVSGKGVLRIGNVSKPTLTLYPAPGAGPKPAVLVCPGGGYNILAYDLEGSEVCEWLNSLGVSAALLKYRVPRRPGLDKHAAPLQDAQRALGLMRANAGKWSIDPKRIGVLGFSAGGHLSAALSTNHMRRTYDSVDAADQESCRPDFSVLVYPAYLTVKEEGDRVSPELPVNRETPPTFLVQSQDDGVRVESSVFYYLALKNAGVKAEMHLYPTGGHGYGLRPSPNGTADWPSRAAEWMRRSGFAERAGGNR